MIIAHVLQSNIYSGAENVICQIIEMFSENDDVSMIYVSPSGPIDHILEEKGIKHFRLNAFTVREIKKAINTINPDVIHAHDFNASVRTAIACKKIPIISHLHNNPLWGKTLNIKTITYTFFSHKYRYIIGVSNSIRDEFFFSRVIKDRFVLIQNVVDSRKVLALADRENTSKVDLIYVGRLSEPKNPIGFLKIIDSLVHDYKINISSEIIGSGELEDRCKEFIIEHKLNENVKLLGFKSNPYVYMKNAKILIMPSLFEGFGLVAVESMILGIPVAALRVGGLVDIIDDECGEICDTIDQLIRKISVLIKDEKKLSDKSKLSRLKASQFTNMEKYKTEIMTIYNQAISFSKRGS